MLWIWQIRTPKGQQKNISMIGVKNDNLTNVHIWSKGRNWMKISPASCKLCSQTRRLINARYLSMQTRGCTLKIVALKSQIFTLVYSKMTKYVPNPKTSIGNTILQAVLCAAKTRVWSMNHTPVAFTSTVAICTNIYSPCRLHISAPMLIWWYFAYTAHTVAYMCMQTLPMNYLEILLNQFLVNHWNIVKMDRMDGMAGIIWLLEHLRRQQIYFIR